MGKGGKAGGKGGKAGRKGGIKGGYRGGAVHANPYGGKGGKGWQGCFWCQGDHLKKDCPAFAKLKKEMDEKQREKLAEDMNEKRDEQSMGA